MEIKYFDHPKMQASLPKKIAEDGDWYRTWSGYYMGRSFHSKVHAAASAVPRIVPINTDKSVEKKDPIVDSFNESLFEDFCELTILEEIKKEKITFFELGAGPGNQSIDVLGMVDFHLCNTQIKEAWSLAVEAEPTHFKWLQDTFRYNGLNGHTLFGAMSNETGWASFDTSRVPEDSYGQALCKNQGSPVPVYTLDYLMKTFHVDHLDLLHMDIQGEEFRVLQGAAGAIEAKQIDYIIECPHTVELGSSIRSLLDSYYECVIDMPTWSGLHEVGLPKPVNMPQDGLQVFRRRDL